MHPGFVSLFWNLHIHYFVRPALNSLVNEDDNICWM